MARLWLPSSTLRRLVDVCAHLGLNVLHVHFTDNEAWRVRASDFPRLTSAQAYDTGDVRALVKYAARQGITIVPEVDLPGHADAVLRAYPQLGCARDDALCPSTALVFARRVLRDVIAIFPAKFVHVGGDEVENWSAGERRSFEIGVAQQLRAWGRAPVAWDDESDVAPPSSWITVWHLGDTFARVRARGHAAIAVPDGPWYFDAVQGAPAQEPPGTRYMSTLEEVYAYAPPAGARGVEAALWTGRIRDEATMWYQLLPRLVAFSVVARNGSARPGWDSFVQNVLPAELRWLRAHAYPYRIPNVIFHVTGRVRYGSVAGDENAAVARVPSPNARISVSEADSAATIWVRTVPGTWQAFHGSRYIAVTGQTIEARAQIGDRWGATTRLRLVRSAVGATSRAYDDVVSP